MEKIKKIKCIDALTLKILAMAFMLCDHMWATVLSNQSFLTDIGRLAFPVFAFQMAEAFYHTSNYKKLMQRLFIFALISEIPFNLMTGGSIIYPFHQNVMFTFLIALLFLKLMEKAKKTGSIWKFSLTVILCAVAGFVIGTLCMVDYFGFGVLTVFLFYLCRDFKFSWIGQIAGMYLINVIMLGGLVIPITIGNFSFEFPQQGFALLSLPLIWLYNGERGKHNKAIQIAYYAFYPVHMLILALLALYVI